LRRHHGVWRVVGEHELILLRELLTLVGELRMVGILRLIVSRDCLTESGPHSDVVGEIGSQSSVKVGIAGLEVCSQTTVLHRKVIILFLVHLLIDNVLLCDTKRPASATLVDLTGSSRTLNASLETSVAATRGSNVCSVIESN